MTLFFHFLLFMINFSLLSIKGGDDNESDGSIKIRKPRGKKKKE